MKTRTTKTLTPSKTTSKSSRTMNFPGRARLPVLAGIPLLAAALGLGWFARPKRPPKPIAAIHGVVFLPSGFLAAGAHVSIHTLPKGRHWTVYADAAGDFLQPVPPRPARYRLRATRRGFAPGQVFVAVSGPQIVDIFIHLHKLHGTHHRS